MFSRQIGYRVKMKVYAFRVRIRPAWTKGQPAVVAPSLAGKAEATFTAQALACTAKARELLVTDIRQHHTIARIARIVHLNARTLQDCFKHLYGRPIFAYLTGLRLEKGKKLLTETDLSIQEIAEECGYAEHTNFTVAFRRKFGVVPGGWRKGKMK